MKNFLIIFVLYFFSAFILQAGSIEIVSIDSLVSVAPHVSETKAKCIFKNASTETKSIKLRVTATKISEGLEVSFCWGPICYPPLTENEPFHPVDVITLSAGETSGDNEFYFTFIPNGYEGEAVIEALLYDRDNPSDSLLLTFRFVSYTLGVEFAEKSFTFSSVIINQLYDLENFGFDLQRTQIFDISGALVFNPRHLPSNDYSLIRNKPYLAIQFSPRKIVLFRF